MWNRIIGLIGPSGSGKSHMAAQILAQSQQATLYQIVRSDTNYLHAATHVFDGDLRAWAKCLDTEPEFRAIYRVPEGSSIARAKSGNKGFVFPDFDAFVRACFARRQLLMMIDEAHLLCDPRYIPTYLWESVIAGRNEFLDIAYVTQGWSMVHRDITRNSKEYFFWRIYEPSDLDGIAERCGEDVAIEVSELTPTEDHRADGGDFLPGDFIHWTRTGYTRYSPRAEKPKEATPHGESQDESSTGTR